MNRFLAAAAVVLAMPFTSIAIAARGDCEPRLLADVTLKVMPDGRVLLPASVRGRDVYFEFDLGSGLPIVRESAIKAVDLHVAPRRGGPDLIWKGRPVTHYAKLEKLHIGDLKMVDRGAFIDAEDEGATPPVVDGRPVIGTMGASLIQTLDVELHFAERRFRLYAPFKCRERSPITWDSVTSAELPMRYDEAGTLVFTLELEGQKIESAFRMNSASSFIDVNATRQFFGFDETSKDVEDGYHPMALTARGLDISDARVRLNSQRNCSLTASTPVYGAIGYQACVNVVPFYVGADLLSRMHLYISKERQKIFVTKD